MVKMSVDPVQVMSGQVKELKVAPSTNGDSRGSWEEKEEFDQDHLGLTTKPKPVSLKCQYVLVKDLDFTLTGLMCSVAAVLSLVFESDVYVAQMQLKAFIL